MADVRKDATTQKQEDVIKEGELPTDRRTAEAGDNRRAGDQDGNRTAPTDRKDSSAGRRE